MVLVLVLVLKDSLRHISCPWGSGPEGPCPCSGPWGQVLVLALVLGGQVLVLVLVHGGQVLVLVLVLGGQVLVNIPGIFDFKK